MLMFSKFWEGIKGEGLRVYLFWFFCMRRTIQPMILDQNYITLKTQVIKAERRILKELGFCVHVKHPHKIIVMYLQVLSFEKNKNLMQLSWNYMNDSLRTDVFVRYQPEVIAAACIYLTARKLKLPLPRSPAWYLVFGVTEAQIKDVCVRILRLYNRPKPNVEILEKKVEELCKQYQDAKVKARGGSENNTPSHSGSPSSPGQKVTGGTHNAWGGFISRSGSHLVPTNEKPPRSKSRSPTHSPVSKHHKRSKKHARSRSRSPTLRAHKKSHKRRASYSRSRSNSPHAKQSRKSGREKRHRSRSRSHERRSASYDKNEKYDKDKNDKYVDRHDRDKYDKYNSKEEKYSEKGDRYLDSDKYEKKDRYNDKNDKNGDKNDKYSRDDREKERYKKSKHRDEERSEIRERSKDKRR